MRNAISLVALATIVFSVFNYWGIRAPDSEVVFRTTEALATRGSFSISDDINLGGFGLAKGQSGELYSLFGPLEAIAAVPLYVAAEKLNTTGWYERYPALVGKSHYIDDGLLNYVNDRTPSNLESHALRTVVSVFNVVVSAIGVLVFYLIIRSLTASEQAALLVAVLYAFGTLILPYSGTFFSEPLATLLVMLSLYVLVRKGGCRYSIGYASLFASGVFLGLATATHITAILFSPFLCLYAGYLARKHEVSPGLTGLLGVVAFSLAFGMLLSLLGYYNFVRFGDIFETGRTVDEIPYATFVPPWRGLWGLLVGPVKGLIWFCPAAILGLYAWMPFHSRHRFLSFMLIGAILVRIVFIASRSDWHGGFGLGPRYLLMIVPILLVPVGEFVGQMYRKQEARAAVTFTLFSLLCIAQQIYFSLGEIFTYLYSIKWYGIARGLNVFKDDFIYMNWTFSPLLKLLDGHRGPLLLQSIPLSNQALWLCMAAFAGIGWLVLCFRFLKAKSAEQVRA